jgi:hypothetical protein
LRTHKKKPPESDGFAGLRCHMTVIVAAALPLHVVLNGQRDAALTFGLVSC